MTQGSIETGIDLTGDPLTASHREWLVTNGRGSFASGTVGGLRTRRYHGLLIAALHPPSDRTVLASTVEETATVDDRSYAMYSAQWNDAQGSVEPNGMKHIERFRLVGTIPEWTYAVGGIRLSKRIWMEQGADITYVRYDHIRGDLPIHLKVATFVEYRGFHETTRAGDWTMDVASVANGVQVTAFPGATRVLVSCESAGVETHHTWYHNEYLAAEDARGLEALTDRLHVGTFTLTLDPGRSATMTLASGLSAEDQLPSALERRQNRDDALLASHEGKPTFVRRLVLAADQFLVSRQVGETVGSSVIAGYPWFGDWGRDTMIAIPGLALATRRPEIAAHVLRTFAGFVDEGMLPNRFPDHGEAPEYNTVDATLWYFDAIAHYYATTGDVALLADLYPVLEDIIHWHQIGTRHRIGVDPKDGLLASGEPGVQLTWMDAKVDDWVVTPRTGKAVEINALWYHALQTMNGFASALGHDGSQFSSAAAKVAGSFDRFWNENVGYCFDVIDGSEGDDAAMRPNQLMAVSLTHSPLPAERQKAVVEACERDLYTPLGLRTLGPNEPLYVGHYGGDRQQRDGAYHQGTVWPWLLGPFVSAHFRVFQDAPRALSYLDAIEGHLLDAGVGTVSEVADGDPPHHPGGAIAQAWSVAEILRAWHEVTERQP
jgi:predicted glycogen debranching enzyme